MLKNFVSLLFGMVTTSQVASQQSQLLDPKDILFSVPTISDELAEVEPAAGDVPEDALAFHEDDWRQVEFVQATRLTEIKKILSEYKLFEAQNRTASGWKNVYVRKIKSQVIVTGKTGSAQIAQLVNGKVRNSIFLASSGGYGRVKHGFAIDLGGNINLYGTTEAAGILTLAASVGSHPDQSKLTDAFAAMRKSLNVVLVDWIAQVVLISASANGKLEVWRP